MEPKNNSPQFGNLDELNFKLLNPNVLIAKIAAKLSEGEGILELDQPEKRITKKKPFGYVSGELERTILVRYPINLFDDGEEGSATSNIFPRIGYLFYEQGYRHDEHPMQGTNYEAIKLKIEIPLQLKNGQEIPRCSLKLVREVPEHDFSQPREFRKDHLRRFCTWQRTKDLESIVPNKLFF